MGLPPFPVLGSMAKSLPLPPLGSAPLLPPSESPASLCVAGGLGLEISGEEPQAPTRQPTSAEPVSVDSKNDLRIQAPGARAPLAWDGLFPPLHKGEPAARHAAEVGTARTRSFALS